ncbi:MAG: hypothetical protein ABIK89_01345 [Planctomycetota bacterium]
MAMPFEQSHSDELWRTICAACDLLELKPRRGNSPTTPGFILADVLQELETAEIVIADLTNLNPNVLYELGIAHTRCDSVILVAREQEELPFDLASMRCIFFDLTSPAGRKEFMDRLFRTIEDLKKAAVPTIIEKPLDRTNVIIEDLRVLGSLPERDLRHQIVWFSGSLGALAISEDEPVKPEDKAYHDALLTEKETLRKLAEMGCNVRCIITPPTLRALAPEEHPRQPQRLVMRMKTLVKLLKSNDPVHDKLEWVVSPFRQKNLYIIGRISYIEGYKKDVGRGYGLSLRQTSSAAIRANISLYEALFDRLKKHTRDTYYTGSETIPGRETLRLATINCLEQAIASFGS